MGHLAWPQQRVSGGKRVTYSSNLHQKVTLQHVEPFILVQVQVQGCTALRVHHLFRYEERSLSVSRNDLISQHTHPERVGVAVAIVRPMHNWNIGRSRAI